jgi:UDP-N-acetylglucosamine 2-epimerase (non-hydrolysing)
MPEEINRLVADAITNRFFTTSEVANDNLRKAGVGDGRIVFVSNTMIDMLFASQAQFRAPALRAEAGLPQGQYSCDAARAGERGRR